MAHRTDALEEQLAFAMRDPMLTGSAQKQWLGYFDDDQAGQPASATDDLKG